MFIGYFDYGVLFLLVIANIYFWKKNLKGKIGCLISGLLFGIVLPIISMKIEITRISKEYEIIDSFNLLYTYFRFPMYWIIGIFQTIVMNVNNKKPAGNTRS
ncbi:MAG: hypothetical protein ACOCWM_04765 [Cyclobacteriaceae bacterium]